MARSVFSFLSRNAVPPLISGPHHYLRLPRNADYRAWAQLRGESRTFLEPWEPSWDTDSLSESSFRARVIRAQQESVTGIAIPLFLFARHGDVLLGGVTIGHIRRGSSQSCMIGYWMGERHAGRGHMSQAVSLSVQHIFSQLGLHRIEAACMPDNIRSIRVLEKAGFQREGYMSGYLKIRGTWRDHLLYARISDQNNSIGNGNT